MIRITTFDKLKNQIKPQTFKKLNELSARAAIEGHQFQLDTTAVEFCL